MSRAERVSSRIFAICPLGKLTSVRSTVDLAGTACDHTPWQNTKERENCSSTYAIRIVFCLALS